MGEYMKGKLTEMMARCPKMGDVRGWGLVNAVEIVEDKATRVPVKSDVIHAVIDRCAENGLLIGSVGRFGNVMRVAPPLTITKEIIDESCEIFEKVMKTI